MNQTQIRFLTALGLLGYGGFIFFLINKTRTIYWGIPSAIWAGIGIISLYFYLNYYERVIKE